MRNDIACIPRAELQIVFGCWLEEKLELVGGRAQPPPENR